MVMEDDASESQVGPLVPRVLQLRIDSHHAEDL